MRKKLISKIIVGNDSIGIGRLLMNINENLKTRPGADSRERHDYLIHTKGKSLIEKAIHTKSNW